MNEEKTILLIDASNLIFRMYFALERSGMTSPDGRPSWAIFGFFKALLDILEKKQPTALIAAFDTKGPTFRHIAEKTYKANRPPEMPEDLAAQWVEIKRGMNLIGLNAMELSGFEADDLIGTLAVQAQEKGWKVLILSGDKDNFQLVNENVKILMPTNTGIQEINEEGVKNKLGVLPLQVVDYKSLCGDSSDNIKGVAGIGEKTAIKLLDNFHSLENILANLQDIKPDSVRKKLIEGLESAKQSQFLATIKKDCPISYPFEQADHKIKPNIPELIEFLREYNLASLEKRLPQIFKTFATQEYSQENLFALNTPLIEQKQEIREHNLQIEYETVFTIEALEDFLQKAKTEKYVALDLETDGLNTFTCNIVGISLAFGSNPYTSIYIPTNHNYLGAEEQLNLEFVLECLKGFFEDWKGQLFIQNLKFEYKILARHGLILPSGALDTMLASYLENPNSSHGLKSLAWEILHFKMQTIDALIGAKGKNQKTMNQINIHEVSKYACDDAALTVALGQYYLSSLSDKLKKLWIEVESPLAFLLSEMELAGIYINAQELKDLSNTLRGRIEKIESMIFKELNINSPINLNSSQQLAKALSQKGFKLSKSTSSGQLSTDSKTLNKLALQDQSGLIENIIEHRMLSKLLSTYTDSLIAQINPLTQRLHGEFNQALTATGRLSSSNPNLQNIPVKNQEFGKLIRSSFQGQNENILIGVDYSQIELRLLAHYTNDDILIDAFNKGQDIHTRTASEIFQVETSEIKPEMRQMGKTLNFALIYQQGAQATAQQLGISQKQALEFIEKYFAVFSSIRPFIEKTIEEARQNGFVETLWGRRRYFKNLNSPTVFLRKEEERAAFNAPLQGSAADMIKIAMLRVSERIKKEKLKAKIILQVHDEIILESYREQLDEIKQILLEEMPINQPLKVPIEVQIAYGKNWAECK